MDSWMRSQYQLDAYREEQRQAFMDLASECEVCGRLYVDECPCIVVEESDA